MDTAPRAEKAKKPSAVGVVLLAACGLFLLWNVGAWIASAWYERQGIARAASPFFDLIDRVNDRLSRDFSGPLSIRTIAEAVAFFWCLSKGKSAIDWIAGKFK